MTTTETSLEVEAPVAPGSTAAPVESEEAAAMMSAERPAPGSKVVLLGLIKTLRPHQWIKNLFVLAPLFFSKTFTEPERALFGLLAALSFCLAAGTVYLLNDLLDVDKDRRHPVKRNRPIARGDVPLSLARTTAWGLAAVTLAMSFAIAPGLAAVILGYLVMNVAYSTALKHVAFIDVTIIALGFVLRVIAGAVAIDVYISEWLFACTFLLALYLGLGKRQHELSLYLAGEVSKTRKVLERYRAEHLDFGVLFVAGMTIAVYTIYTLTAALPDQPLRTQATPFASPWLPITIPFAVFGITRFYQLIHRDSPYSPTEQLLRDVAFIVNLALWGLVMLVLSVS
jgi:decaprenyl-phosphate phosphoribosyltransferase